MHLHVGDVEGLGLDVGATVYGGEPPVYDGPQEITPGEFEQVLDMDGKCVVGDVTIYPIPDNYGRIAYSGSGLLVY